MRLIDPGTGELSDRLSILALKLLFGREAGKDVSHFEKEQTSILIKIRTKDLNGAWFHCYTELAAVNAALWHAEDALRRLREDPPSRAPTVWEDIGRLAIRIQAFNDRRAELIAAINKEAGDGDGPEKAFT